MRRAIVYIDVFAFATIAAISPAWRDIIYATCAAVCCFMAQQEDADTAEEHLRRMFVTLFTLVAAGASA